MSKDKVKKIKHYLSFDNPIIGRVYFGNVDHQVDQGLESAIKLVEKKISKAINRSVEGLLWKAGGLNPDTSVEDIQNSINLISKAQASVQTTVFRGEPNSENDWSFQFFAQPTIENPDPYNTQVDSIVNSIYPSLTPETLTQDERALAILELMKDQEETKEKK